MKKSNVAHIVLIVLGIIFISLSAFHTSLWFDESYSVAMAKHSFSEIWTITGGDVHPPVYYWLIHIVYLIFGNNILMFRLFSVLAVVILGILGYTHIRKDFGEKTGLYFSFLVFFLPVITSYAQEIRMYSWACLFVTITALYAYRFYKNIKEGKSSKNLKNLIIFGIFSILSCYTHYYALVTVALINLLLLVYVIKNKSKAKKSFIEFLILAVVQIVLYIPWLGYLFSQIHHVQGGFWIAMGIVQTPVEVLSFQLRRQLDNHFAMNLHTIIALLVSLILYVYLYFKIRKGRSNGTDVKPAIFSFAVYIGVVLLMCLLSLIIWQPILFSRYLFILTGLWIFGVSFLLAQDTKKSNILIIFGVILILSCIANVQNMNINLSSSNDEVYNYMKDYVKEDDIIVYSNIGNGGVVCALFPDNKQYFLNFDHWDIDVAYQAYGPGMETVYDYSFLDNYTGRIWLIDSENMGLFENIPKNNIITVYESKEIYTAYHDYIYNIMLIEKY